MQNKIKLVSLEKKQKVILVIGKPCSGKGAQCKILSERTHFIHLSLGDIVRAMFQESQKNPEAHDNEMILNLKRSLKQGDQLDDALSVRFIIEEAQKYPEAKGYLIDGCPRTLRQLDLLESKFKIDTVIYLKVPEEVIRERSGRRRAIEHRPDDQEEVMNRRIRLFNEDTLPVIRVLQNRNKHNFIEIDSRNQVADVAQLIQFKLAKLDTKLENSPRLFLVSVHTTSEDVSSDSNLDMSTSLI